MKLCQKVAIETRGETYKNLKVICCHKKPKLRYL